MSNRLDSAVRDALARIADAAPPPGLAASAIRAARRQRRVRATVASAASAAALALATPLAFATSSPEVDNPPGDPAMGPLVIASISPLDGNGDTSLVLDRITGEYVELPYRKVTPSPDGTRELVLDRDSRSGPQIGIRDARTGTVRWIEDYGLAGNETVTAGTWSRDGREILITERQGPTGFAIVDATTLGTTFVEHNDIRTMNTVGLPYVWTPDGNGIALTLTTTRLGKSTVLGIRFYDRDGNPTRTVEATAALTSEAGFSPDGTQMVLQSDRTPSIQIVDTDTGEVRYTLSGSGFVAWADNDHLVVRDYARESLRVVTLTGDVVQEMFLPGHFHGIDFQQPWWTELHIGSSDGLNPAAARLTLGVP